MTDSYSLPEAALYEVVLRALREHESRCLDNAEEREIVARGVAKAIKDHEIQARNLQEWTPHYMR